MFNTRERDRYGFEKPANQAFTDFETKYNTTLSKLEEKWERTLKENRGLIPPKSAKMKALVRKGIPSSLRGRVWFFYSGAETRMNNCPSLFDRMLDKANRYSSNLEIIQRDIPKIFPSNIYFQPKQNEKSCLLREKLTRVLLAFGQYKQDISYCQALGYIAALLLLFMDNEEQAFWMLVTLVSDIMPSNTYSTLNGFEGTRIDQDVFWQLIQDKNSLLYKKLITEVETVNGKSSSIVTADWFMRLYVDILPVETVLRVWDCLFYEGSKILFRTALVLFKQFEMDLFRIRVPTEIYGFLTDMPKCFYDCEELIKKMFSRLICGSLPKAMIEEKRQEIFMNIKDHPNSLGVKAVKELKIGSKERHKTRIPIMKKDSVESLQSEMSSKSLKEVLPSPPLPPTPKEESKNHSDQKVKLIERKSPGMTMKPLPDKSKRDTQKLKSLAANLELDLIQTYEHGRSQVYE